MLRQLDIYGEENEISRVKKNHKRLIKSKNKAEILDNFPTNPIIIKKDINNLINELSKFVISREQNTKNKKTIRKTVAPNFYNQNRRYEDVPIGKNIEKHYCIHCHKVWYQDKFASRRYGNRNYFGRYSPSNSELICPKCNSIQIRITDKNIYDCDKFGDLLGYPIFYIHKINETTIRINRFHYQGKYNSKEDKYETKISLFSYAIIDFFNKTISCKKILKHNSKTKRKEYKLVDFLLLSKKGMSKFIFPNNDTLDNFINDNLSIKKYSGLKEYIDVYRKFQKNTDSRITNNDEFFNMSDERLLLNYLITFDKIPQIELLMKSQLKSLTSEIIINMLSYNVSETKNNLEKINLLINPNGKKQKDILNLPSYIVDELIKRNCLNLNNYCAFLKIYQGYNSSNQLFKNEVYNLELENYNQYLDNSVEKYKIHDGIKKLINKSKKQKLSFDDFKILVRDTNLESFGKDKFIKFMETYDDYNLNQNILFTIDNVSDILVYNIPLNKEIKYLINSILSNEENLNEYHLLEENNPEELSAFVSSFIIESLLIHKDYINMAMETMDIEDGNLIDVPIDKFPANLKEVHDRYARAIADMNSNRRELEANEFQKTIEARIENYGCSLEKGFEDYTKDKKFFKESEYTLVFPKRRRDIVEEAQRQSNCLASYITPYAKRNTIIAFLRKKDDIDRNLITIEYNHSGGIKQAFYSHNRTIHDEDINSLIRKYGSFIKQNNYKKEKV